MEYKSGEDVYLLVHDDGRDMVQCLARVLETQARVVRLIDCGSTDRDLLQWYEEDCPYELVCVDGASGAEAYFAARGQVRPELYAFGHNPMCSGLTSSILRATERNDACRLEGPDRCIGSAGSDASARGNPSTGAQIILPSMGPQTSSAKLSMEEKIAPPSMEEKFAPPSMGPQIAPTKPSIQPATGISEAVIFCDAGIWCYMVEYVESVESGLRRKGVPFRRVLYSDSGKDRIDWNEWNHHQSPSRPYLFVQRVPPQVMAWRPRVSPLAAINTEQCTRRVIATRCVDYARKGVQVLDYSETNVGLLRDLVGEADGLPKPLWLPYQVRDEVSYDPFSPKDLTVVHVGVMGGHRLAVHASMTERGLAPVAVSGWGAQRDRQMERAVVLVNTHFDPDYRVFEHVRCDRWIFARMLVVSERCEGEQALDIAPHVTFCEPDRLAETVEAVLKDPRAEWEACYGTASGFDLERIDARRFEALERCVAALASGGDPAASGVDPAASGRNPAALGKTRSGRTRAVVDCFPFYNELDMLDMRLHELDDVVERFVLVEATRTHAGNPKRLHYLENRARFERFAGRIVHVVVDDMPSGDSWVRENHQRDCIARGLAGLGLDDEDVVMVSDVDEVPHAGVVRGWKERGLDVITPTRQRFFYYDFAHEQPNRWGGTVAGPWREVKRTTPQALRQRRNQTPAVEGGWHCSYFGDARFIANKIAQFAHQEYNTSTFVDPLRIEERVRDGVSLFDDARMRPNDPETDPNLPRYRHLIAPKPPAIDAPAPVTTAIVAPAPVKPAPATPTFVKPSPVTPAIVSPATVEPASGIRRTLIVYAYHEDNSGGAARNLRFFARHGMFPDADREHVVVINGPRCTVRHEIPAWTNTRVVERENAGFDFGAWAHALRGTDLGRYDLFVFLNSSVTGPFLPTHAGPTRSWPRAFGAMLRGPVRLAGTTINANPSPHVQSMVLATDRIGLRVLFDAGIFRDNDRDLTKVEVVYRREVAASDAILRAGHQIDCLLPRYRGRRWTPARGPPASRAQHELQEEARASPTQGDRYFCGQYFGHDVDPLDVVFYKTNRGCGSRSLAKYLALADEERARRADVVFDPDVRGALAVLKGPERSSAWKGHLEFAVWLVARFGARVVVDLGVDHGHSTFAWGLAGAAEVHGIDHFRGDALTGYRDTRRDVEALGTRLVSEFGMPDAVRIVRSSFAEAAAGWDRPIDVLHIDGEGTAEATREAYDLWAPKVAENGFVLIHDVVAFGATIGNFFRSLPIPKTSFAHSAGLGVLCRDPERIGVVEKEWRAFLVQQGGLRHAGYDLSIAG